jgi:ribosomal protein S18 acetylase RimI-like enzyme
MESTVNLQLLGPSDWRVLREARLQALRDSPKAFASDYAHESQWGELEWRRTFALATWIIARKAESVIGLARSIGEPDTPGSRHLESIWVAPDHRRRGVCRTLLHALAEKERQTGVTDLLLWVLEDNDGAQRAYEALGFELTGERQFLKAAGRFEQRLKLTFRDVPGSQPTAAQSAVVRSTTELGQSPTLQLQEVHCLMRATDGVHTV